MAVSDPTLNSADELRTYRQPADHVGSYWGAHVVLFVLFVAALGLAAFTPKQAVVFESTTSIQMVSVLAGLMVGILVTHEILHYIAARSLGFEAAFVIAKIPGVPLVNPAVRLNATGALVWQWRIIFAAPQLLTIAALLAAIIFSIIGLFLTAAICIIGALPQLRCGRLRHESY